MRALFLVGWLCLSYTLAQQSVDKVLKNFKDAYNYYEDQFGKEFMSSRGFSTVEYPKPTITDGQCFDFIIVGAGSSGCVLANRLSKNPKWKVLLLEAGGKPDVLTNIPSTSILYKMTDLNWNITGERPSNTNPLLFQNGKSLGGSSMMNYMIADRGNPKEYDYLASLGNTGWSYEEILPFFQKVETANVENIQKRGTNGPVNIETLNKRTKLSEFFVKSAESLGYHYGNRNSGNGNVSYPELMLLNGFRVSAEKAYLQPIKDRPNLSILTKHFVTKINFDKGTLPKTTGVTMTNVLTKTKLTVNAKKEVVLCAGVFGNPNLLMHSGIGPDSLNQYNIPVVKNLPVGQTFFNQITTGCLLYKTKQKITINSKEMISCSNLKQLIKEGSGPASSSLGIQAVAHLRTSTFTKPKSITNVQLRLMSTSFYQSSPIFGKMSIYRQDVYGQILKQLNGIQNVFVLQTNLAIPESVGKVELVSSSIYDPLKVSTNLYQNPNDKNSLLEGIREHQRLASTSIFKESGAEPIFIKLNECKHTEENSDEYWLCIVEHVLYPDSTGGGTCRMGPKSDPKAVVDPNLKVRGVKNLRVAGKSVLPHPLSAYENLPSLMIAEYAAHKIIEACQ